jgi:hypothetical protein
MVYINVDAALFPLFRWMEIGVVIGTTMTSDLLLSANYLRSSRRLALRRALSLAGAEGFDKLTLIAYLWFIVLMVRRLTVAKLVWWFKTSRTSLLASLRCLLLMFIVI